MSSSAELLVHQLFVTVASGGSYLQRVIFANPVEVKYSKEMVSLAGIAKAFLDWLVIRGSVTGITLLHQVHDGGMTQKYRRAVCHVMKSHVMEDVRKLQQGVVPAQSCLSLHVTCVLHALHNSLHWSFQTSFPIGGWLVETLCPAPVSQLPSPESLREFYACLGVPSDVLQLIAAMIYWCASTAKLLVADSFMQKEGSFEVVSSLLASLWKFPRFCGSRWLTMGASARAVVLAHASGFQSAFVHLRSHGHLSDWDATGGDKIGAHELQHGLRCCKLLA
eukprot:6067516-Amphidinium_carterae.1